MAEQQRASRKKLHPKIPIKKIADRRRAALTHTDKEETLTRHQQAWARSFTVSLSGWRGRQKFLKDHLESHLQTEAQSKAAEAGRQAHLPVQRAALEKDQTEIEALLQAEAEEEHAERAGAWADKAWKMHIAGLGVRNGKHNHFGWDPEAEEYPRNIELKNLIAERRARRKARFKAKYGFSGSENSDYDDSKSGGGLDIETLVASSRPMPQPASIVERAPVVHWREKACTGITKKKLSVTKRWSAMTWNQKSNIQERLSVLEEDGYNIQTLLDEKATSDEVTTIILERAAGQQSDSSTGQPYPQSEKCVSPKRGSGRPSPSWLDPALRDSAPRLPNQASSPYSRSETKSPVAPSPHSVQVSQQQTNNAEDIEDNTQPYSFDEPYCPQASRRLKRKRDDNVDSDMGDTAAASFPAFEKPKLEFVTGGELAAQTLRETKRAVIRQVFRSTRSANQRSLSPPRIIFSAETPTVIADALRSQPSTLEYLHPDNSRDATAKSFFSISTCGSNNMMSELRFLTNDTNEDITIHIYNPDYDDDSTHTPVKPEDRVTQNILKMQRQNLRITIKKDEQGQVIFQGDATTLAELLKVLREQELLHHVDWEWDGLRLQRSNDMPRHLSPGTQNTFIDIENRLRRRARTGGVEILVHRIDGSQTNRS